MEYSRQEQASIDLEYFWIWLFKMVSQIWLSSRVISNLTSLQKNMLHHAQGKHNCLVSVIVWLEIFWTVRDQPVSKNYLENTNQKQSMYCQRLRKQKLLKSTAQKNTRKCQKRCNGMNSDDIGVESMDTFFPRIPNRVLISNFIEVSFIGKCRL